MGIEGIEISKLSGKLQQLATAADEITKLKFLKVMQMQPLKMVRLAKMITKQSLVLISKQLNRQQILSKQHILKKMLKEWKSML